MFIRFYRWLMEEPKPCDNCELLRSLLETEKYEKKQMLETILNLGKPTAPPITEQVEYKPILPKHIPWNVRRQMLEQEDRVKAQLMRDKAKETADIEKLEKELKLVPEEKLEVNDNA